MNCECMSASKLKGRPITAICKDFGHHLTTYESAFYCTPILSWENNDKYIYLKNFTNGRQSGAYSFRISKINNVRPRVSNFYILQVFNN